MDATSELAIVQPPAYEPAYPTLSPNWNIDRDQHCRFDSGTILQLAAAGLEDRSRLLNNLRACRTEAGFEEMVSPHFWRRLRKPRAPASSGAAMPEEECYGTKRRQLKPG